MTQFLSTTDPISGGEAQSLAEFRAGLSQADQQALDDLLGTTEAYEMALTWVSRGIPIQMMLLMMLLEQHKKLSYLFNQLNYYQQQGYQRQTRGHA